jgi:mercuric ion transport protein
MDVSGGISVSDNSSNHGAVGLDKAPIVGGLFVGLIGSLCCGGGLVFGAIGLGALYGALAMARYIPEALAGSTILILLLNWLYYGRKAARVEAAGTDCGCSNVRRAALWSTFIGLVAMAGAFVFLEWLNHGVVHAAHFMHNPAYASAVIPGVPNLHLIYVAVTFLALPVLGMLPFPPAAIGRLRMNDRALITAGAIGAIVAAICCATPLLAVVLGSIGLTAWLAKADYAVMPVLFLGVVLVGFGLYRRYAAATCHDASAKQGDAG